MEQPLSLPCTYVLWYHKRPEGKPQSSTKSWEDSLKQIASFSTVQDFWKIYQWIIRPAELQFFASYYLFREGIKPMWEDPINSTGGSWILKIKKDYSSKFWEDLILAMLGCDFNLPPEEICGIAVTIRPKGDNLSVWHKTGKDKEIKETLKQGIRRVLNLPESIFLEYQKHSKSIEMISEAEKKDEKSEKVEVMDGSSIEAMLLKGKT